MLADNVHLDQGRSESGWLRKIFSCYFLLKKEFVSELITGSAGEGGKSLVYGVRVPLTLAENPEKLGV